MWASYDQELSELFSGLDQFRVDALLKSLPYREARAVVLRMGLGKEKSHTFKELAPLFGVQAPRARSIFMRAAQKIIRANFRKGSLKIQCDPYVEHGLLMIQGFVPLDVAKFKQFFDKLKTPCATFAVAANVSSGAVHRWLRPLKGGVRYASPDNVCKLAQIMSVVPVWLLKNPTERPKGMVRAANEAGVYKKGMVWLGAEPRNELKKMFKAFERKTGWQVRNPDLVYLEPVGFKG